jgi:accessory colonization factor AcfC
MAVRRRARLEVFFCLFLITVITVPAFANPGKESGEPVRNGTLMKGLEKLLIVGPGGPYEAMKEAGEIFSNLKGVLVEVIKGPPETWFNQEADLIYGGAPNMIEDFMAGHPGVIDPGSICQLSKRQIGIVVRRGNPRKIRSLDDLGREGLKVLNVELETMGKFQQLVPNITDHIYKSVRTGDQGILTWRSVPELDAWITYKSWHVVLNQESEFIPLSFNDAWRSTPIAVTTWTKQRGMADEFIAFLKSQKGAEIFRRRGWE